LPNKSCTYLSPKFATCATNLFPLVDKIQPLTNQRDIIDIVNVQSVRINDLISFTCRLFSFVSHARHTWLFELYRTRWRHLQILVCFHLSQNLS
jgi:hypothetical protein